LRSAGLPVVCQHAVNTEIEPAVMHPFGFSQNSFFNEFQALRNCAAAVVPCGATNLDPVQPEIVECFRKDCAACGSHDALALVGCVEPVPDCGILTAPINLVEANSTTDCSPMVDCHSEAIVIRYLPGLLTQPVACMLDRIAWYRPRHPLPQALDIAIDHPEKFFRILFAHRTQIRVIIQLNYPVCGVLSSV